MEHGPGSGAGPCVTSPARPEMAMRKPTEAIVETLQAMLDERMPWISGAHAIYGLMSDAGLIHDPDFAPFIGVVSETDALPIDAKLRELWNQEALLALQPRIVAKELWARQFLKPRCERLLARLNALPEMREGNN